MKPGNRRNIAAVPIPTECIFCKIRWLTRLLSCRKGFFIVYDCLALKEHNGCFIEHRRVILMVREGKHYDKETFYIRIGYRGAPR